MSDRIDDLVRVVDVAEDCLGVVEVAQTLREGVAQAAQVGIVKEATKQLIHHQAPTPVGAVLRGFKDGANGVDNSASHTKEAATGAVAVVGLSTASAAAAGAGALTGYAGMASAVSVLGLGSASTALASAVGITAASGAPLVGAAATTALTAAVGGPVVAGVLVVGTVATVGYGAYKAANWIGGKVRQALSLSPRQLPRPAVPAWTTSASTPDLR